ncbi:hypothetical protein Tco_0144178 [Tanacetum coccineum]
MKNALWIYWTRGGDEVEPTNEESSDSDDEDEVTEIFRTNTKVFDFDTPIWKDDRYCNGGNLPGAYIFGNTLRYQDLEWYEALEDGNLIEEALKNKAILEGITDEDDESSNEERCESFNDTTRNASVCNIRRFEMIKYSFGEDQEYVAIKEHEYDDLTSTNEDACRTYQEIFRRMDEGWMVTRAE